MGCSCSLDLGGGAFTLTRNCLLSEIAPDQFEPLEPALVRGAETAAEICGLPWPPCLADETVPCWKTAPESAPASPKRSAPLMNGGLTLFAPKAKACQSKGATMKSRADEMTGPARNRCGRLLDSLHGLGRPLQ